MFLKTIVFGVFCVGQTSSKNPFVEAAKLGSLAKTSALHAQNLAHRQQVAAKYAAFSVKNDLAQSAIAAASSALVAVASKKLEIDSLQNRLKEAEKILDAELEQYDQLKQIVATFSKAAEDSQSQVDILRQILENVKNNTRQDAAVKSDDHISFGTGFH